MTRTVRFRYVLPIAQAGVAALMGGIGLLQRQHLLGQRLFGDQTFWDSTARFHIWPWPYKFAVIANIPAFFAGLLPAWGVEQVWPRIPETVEGALSLPFVPLVWYWVGYRLSTSSSTALRFLLVFTLACAVGAVLPIGYVGFIPYGILVWLIALIWLMRRRKPMERVAAVMGDGE